MNYFFDTEFIEYPGHIDLISIGMVSEDGRELYHISNEFDPSKANDWVKEHVFPKLPPVDKHISRNRIKEKILTFIGDDRDPHFWAYFADYDWVVFCQLFGTMSDLPKGWPMFCMDLKQVMVTSRYHGKLPLEPKNAHNALVDAKWLKNAYDVVIGKEDS